MYYIYKTFTYDEFTKKEVATRYFENEEDALNWRPETRKIMEKIAIIEPKDKYNET